MDLYINLHSTMVLLKLKEVSQKINVLSISTFHYGSIKIKNKTGTWISLLPSTFHYGSIKIIIVLELEIAIK